MAWAICSGIGTLIVLMGTMFQALEALMGKDSIWLKLLWEIEGQPNSSLDAACKSIADYPSEEDAFRRFPEHAEEILKYRSEAINWMVLSAGTAVLSATSWWAIFAPEDTSWWCSLLLVAVTGIFLMIAAMFLSLVLSHVRAYRSMLRKNELDQKYPPPED